MKYRVTYAGICIRGDVRKNNEDNYWCEGEYLPMIHEGADGMITGSADCTREHIRLAVFDGMGGENCGEAASYLAAQTMDKQIQQDSSVSNETMIYAMNDAICSFTEDEHCGTSGSTAVLIDFYGSRAVCTNLGDSRIYLFRQGELQQISKDHTAKCSLFRKAPLEQFLGVPEEEFRVSPDTAEVRYKKGDRYLLCSDGVTDVVSDEVITRVFQETADVQTCCSRLREEIERRTATDNTTFFVCEIQRSLF